MVAGRNDAGATAESSHLIHRVKAERERAILLLVWAFETSKPTPVTHL